MKRAARHVDGATEQLNVFGRKFEYCEGEHWHRQRKLTAPNFNERTSSLVWHEATRQAKDMTWSWILQEIEGTRETCADTATLALHVLTSVGFGLSYPFHGGVQALAMGHLMTCRDALSQCLENIITFAVFPKTFLTSSFLPKRLRSVGIAVQEFQMYMEEMLSYERRVAATLEEGSGNLIGSLVRASEAAQTSTGPTHSNHLCFTNDEIFGNIFAFNLAGHETTANTLASAIVLLAAKSQYQEWIGAEIRHILSKSSNASILSYEETFPKLQRCLAIMYETLRLYGSIAFILKPIDFHAQTVTAKQKAYLLTKERPLPSTSKPFTQTLKSVALTPSGGAGTVGSTPHPDQTAPQFRHHNRKIYRA